MGDAGADAEADASSDSDAESSMDPETKEACDSITIEMRDEQRETRGGREREEQTVGLMEMSVEEETDAARDVDSEVGCHSQENGNVSVSSNAVGNDLKKRDDHLKVPRTKKDWILNREKKNSDCNNSDNCQS